MFTDIYHFGRVGLTTAALAVGGQIATTKPVTSLEKNQYGEVEYIQELSMLENGIKKFTAIIENLDAAVVANLLIATNKKTKEVNKIYSAAISTSSGEKAGFEEQSKDRPPILLSSGAKSQKDFDFSDKK